MCEACWEVDFSRSKDLPENWEKIVDDIHLLYSLPGCDGGGPLHVNLEDFGISGKWEPYNGPSWPREAVEVAQRICDAMNLLSDAQRAAIVARWEGWF